MVDQDITPAILLQHMQGMEKRLNTKIDSLEDTMSERFDRVDERFDEIEKRLEHLEQDVFILVVRTKAMHEQLQNIEKGKLPKIRKSVRKMGKKLKEQEAVKPTTLVKV
jgi:hypothetical protein